MSIEAAMTSLRKLAAQACFVILFLPLWLLAFLAMLIAIGLDGGSQALSVLFGRRAKKTGTSNEAGARGAESLTAAQPPHYEKANGPAGAAQGPNRVGSRH